MRHWSLGRDDLRLVIADRDLFDVGSETTIVVRQDQHVDIDAREQDLDRKIDIGPRGQPLDIISQRSARALDPDSLLKNVLFKNALFELIAKRA